MLNIREITPEIYHLKFIDQDNMSLHLLRFSDYYESDNEQFYRNKFNLADVVQLSYKKNKDVLKLSDGINLPVSIVYKMGKDYGAALSVRERFVLSLVDVIKAEQPALKYLIATVGEDEDVDQIFHELSHGFYYTDEAYKLRMDALISTLGPRVKKEMYKYLTRLGYNKSVHDDEFQAYMATGLLGEEKEVCNEKLLNMFRAPFVDVFMETVNTHDLI